MREEEGSVWPVLAQLGFILYSPGPHELTVVYRKGIKSEIIAFLNTNNISKCIVAIASGAWMRKRLASRASSSPKSKNEVKKNIYAY